MSLILEALRKSEAERRRGQAPDIHRDLSLAATSARAGPPTWPWWLGAAVMASALLLVAWRWWPARAPAAPVHAGVASSQAQVARTALPAVTRLSPAGQAPPGSASRPRSAVSAAPVAPMPASVAASAPATTPSAPRSPSPGFAAGGDVPVPAAARPASMPPRNTAPSQAAPAPATPVDDTVALSDLSVGERKALPPLKLSMHLWNTDPAKRFVIVDGNRLREGDRAGDAVVTSITEDGVVLDWNGRRIRLSIR